MLGGSFESLFLLPSGCSGPVTPFREIKGPEDRRGVEAGIPVDGIARQSSPMSFGAADRGRSADPDIEPGAISRLALHEVHEGWGAIPEESPGNGGRFREGEHRFQTELVAPEQFGDDAIRVVGAE